MTTYKFGQTLYSWADGQLTRWHEACAELVAAGVACQV